ncbi:hypothetical protein ADEAN_000823500 [Angomonas deanei]|uniref:Uncharacterized protein n=1 Tax=Angomonas deanei TaxID=59799 RepID=A0A7G2CQ96_9TRYP|nr:hypothetical protein ADEAN_000823500 [Angomonas deanei]
MAVIPPSVKATSPSKKTTKKAKKLTKQQKKVALRIIKKLKKAPQGKITIKPATKADKKKIRKIKKLQTSTKAPTRKAVLLAKQKKSKKTKKATKRPVTDPLLTKKLVSKPIEHEALVVRQIMSEFLPDEKLKKSDSKGMRAVLSLTKKGGKIPDEETILKQFEQEAKKGKTVKKVNKKKK